MLNRVIPHRLEDRRVAASLLVIVILANYIRKREGDGKCTIFISLGSYNVGLSLWVVHPLILIYMFTYIILALGIYTGCL